jgi:hypothetical protein
MNPEKPTEPSGSIIVPPQASRAQRRQLKAIERRLRESLAKGNFASAAKHWNAYKRLTGDQG